MPKLVKDLNDLFSTVDDEPVPACAVYIGVDPGASGGLVMLRGDEVVATKMPETERDIWTWFNDSDLDGQVHRPTKRFAVIEKVGGYISGNALPGSAMFSFGRSYGFLRGCLIAASIPFEEITPQKWQRALGIQPRDNKGGEGKGDFKRRLKQRAQQLYPAVNVTLANCDSLLIATYAKRWQENTLNA